MSRAATSVFVFGCYLAVNGLLLIAKPGLLLNPLGIATPTEPWIHVLGVVVLVLSAYYIGACRTEQVGFFRMTTWVRPGALAGFVVLALLGDAPWAIVGFGVVDLLGALWTSAALKADAKG